MYKVNNTLNTSFDTASITKLFTAAGIVLLESKGKINFEDNIHSIVNLSGTKIPKDVKIKHLLTHTSGIADDAEEEKGGDIIRVHKDGSNAGVCNITVFYPKDDITFSILGNVECNIWELQSKAEKILFA